ncbi:unnamed protein product [Arctia plantaginis]|uniref:Major facilitator superfamily (MFS) profile domain-containing protein n=1 Tax=Arctia plantaginis TaxID=874455 RepID=A0A8S0Z829_ARCPL|nr:unnamed protein product [Arctia plantaginis]
MLMENKEQARENLSKMAWRSRAEAATKAASSAKRRQSAYKSLRKRSALRSEIMLKSFPSARNLKQLYVRVRSALCLVNIYSLTCRSVCQYASQRGTESNCCSRSQPDWNNFDIDRVCFGVISRRKGSIAMMETETKVVDGQEKTKEDTDPITKSIGAFGKWQFWICVIVFLVKFPVAWHQMSIIFLSPPMNFTCSSSEPGKFDNVCNASCSNYVYDHSVFQETIVSQWNLVCERQWLKNLTQTIFMLGILIGNMMFGHLSDRYGRRLPFLAAVFLQLISGVATAYSVDWYMFTALRFFLAVATGGTMVTSFVLIMELIGTKYRDTVGILYQIPFNLGHLTLPLFSYYLRDWSTFQLAISLPSILFLSYFFLLPESPRWLLTSGKAEEAVKIMTTAAIMNGRPTDNIAQVAQKMNVEISGKQEEHASFIDLFRTPKLRARTIAILYNWFVCGLCFFGVSQYIGHVSGKIFTNVAISAAILVPGTIISIYTNRILGRKITLICANCITGFSCLLIIFVPQSGAGHLTLGCIGLFGLSISFATKRKLFDLATNNKVKTYVTNIEKRICVSDCKYQIKQRRSKWMKIL